MTASLTASCIGLFITSLFVILFGEENAQDLLVTCSLLPAVLGYALLMECIANIRHMEQTPDASQVFGSRLGQDPGPLRFQYGVVGVRLVQLMCAILFGSLVYLSSNNLYFLRGILLLIFFALIILIMLLVSNAKKTPLNANEIYTQLSFYLRQTFYETLNPKIPEADYELMDTSLSNLVPNDSMTAYPQNLEQQLTIHLPPHEPDPLSSSCLTDFVHDPSGCLDSEDLVL